MRGCTALLDAIGDAVRHIRNVHKYARDEDRPEKTLFIITTDGMENASRRYSYEMVKQLIEAQKKDADWEFLFLGANIDAVQEAARFGINANRAVEYTCDSEGTRKNFSALGKAVKGFRAAPKAARGSAISDDWKEEIEEEAKASLRFVSDKTSSIIFDENGELVAFGITFPTISKALQKCKGHLFPFGWYHLLKAMRDYDTVDLMINGAVPKWQNTGVSAIYHSAMSEKYIAAGTRWAIANPQIESNVAVNVWSKYDSELYMRRRCYIKQI